MKKVIMTALMLVLIASIGWANEITLSADSDGRTSVMGDDPGAIPVPPKGEHNAGQIIIWDDGVMDDYWQDNYSRAVQFTAPMDCHVTQGMVYQGNGGIMFTPYLFAIYDDAEGFPGERLGGVMTTGGVNEGWNEINIIPAGVILNEGDVFYGVAIKNNSEYPYFCSDTTEPIHGNFYNYPDPSGVEWTFDELSDFMLRIIVDDDVTGPYTDNPNPAPGESGVHGDTTVTFEICDANYEVVLDTIIVVVDGNIVTDECTISKISLTGDYVISYKPEKSFDLGDIYVYWYAEDELGNGDEDTWYFTVDVNSDDSSTEETTWGVIKDKF
ncbi:MAG TPA: hypothetical protein VM054_01210 [bacterium]|nr:hypothetical protein [bacterium]